MTVVGVDFGSLHSKIGVARHRGIDIIANEVSNRATPSLVAFDSKQRQIGESAKTQETANFKNTIGSLKRLAGRTFGDKEIQGVEKKFINAQLADVSGTVGVQVSYLFEKKTFTATQLVAMYFGKIRDTASAELKAPVTDIVIAVPGWFTDIQRRAIQDAALIANLNPLRLINEHAAVALGYGITKSDLPVEPEPPRHVVFVDVGHSAMSVTVVAFSKGNFRVLATAYDHNLGGRDIDYALVQHFAKEFQTKYKIDILSNPKATFRLAAGCEKLKKVLSSNAEGPLNVESIMNDVDVSSKLHRDDYEALIGSVLEGVSGPCQRALADSGLTLEQIDAIELVGGSTRIPAVRAKIAAVFNGKALSTTLNQDEAVARGATFACAMLSPTFKVRDFIYHDANYYPIKLTWEQTGADDDTELMVFDRKNAIPSTKVLTFHRNQNFELEAVYADPAGLPGSTSPWISKFTSKAIPPNKDGSESTVVKVKARLDSNSMLSFAAAYTEELEEREVAGETMEVDGAEQKKTKKYVKKNDVTFIAGSSSLDKTLVEKYKEEEAQMHASDKLVVDTADRKNALEEYVYDTRSKLDSRYAVFVKSSEKEALLSALQVAEDWLYTEEGEDANKSAYVERLTALHALGKPIEFRWREAEDRRGATAQLRETLNSYMSKASSGAPEFEHIDRKDLDSIVEKCATIQKWLDDQNIRQMERAKDVDPILTTKEIKDKRDEIIYFATPILTRPKPKPSAPPSGTATPNPPGGTDTPPPPPPPKDDIKMEEGQEPSAMDVD